MGRPRAEINPAGLALIRQGGQKATVEIATTGGACFYMIM
jgi:hypothetical protein